jgi:LmbE family N-acetylglucosaminyl deacetylase
MAGSREGNRRLISLGSTSLSNAKQVLCLGAHCDDIEIGCGGTLLRLLELKPDLSIVWIAFSSDALRAGEARASAGIFLSDVAEPRVSIETFRGRYFPYVGGEIKEYFDQLAVELDPDVIFTHYRFDLHQDHRLTCELTLNTFRDHLILEYEIPKYDGDVGQPNVYVPLDASQVERKVSTILSCFQSQRDKHWFTEETFRAMLRLRGIESKSPSGYAEAFHCRKLVLA